MKSGLRFVCHIAGNPNPFKPQTEMDLASLLMQEAALQVFNGEIEQRKITGIISHADWMGTDGNKTLYTLTKISVLLQWQIRGWTYSLSGKWK